MTNENDVGRKLLSLEELPKGAMDRYVGDVYQMSDKSKSFEDFKKDFWDDHEKECLLRNQQHPIAFDKKYIIRPQPFGMTIHAFKRSGEEWSFYEDDSAPNGGGGNVSLQRVLSLLSENDKNELKTELEKLS